MGEHHDGWASFVGQMELSSEDNLTGFEVKLSVLTESEETEYALHVRIARYSMQRGRTNIEIKNFLLGRGYKEYSNCIDSCNFVTCYCKTVEVPIEEVWVTVAQAELGPFL
ncbi:hypothetical protein FY534_07700 [Alicyclobacillus sp. TC]|uniref:Uncharacterized protein n=1 Tax=Alicyclobacillus tolerans TaxID=90970 RepID=A0ABT9LZC9_9BACL|nr:MULTISPECIES: hypothetical protein [Alicyclobacillus]MDP9729601.1 hypothetical protein [Alicyclobacillus tengchongensis]QRF23565.1 hypothetical protein FY534_07700 [Alicyclobacillus sp. TC]